MTDMHLDETQTVLARMTDFVARVDDWETRDELDFATRPGFPRRTGSDPLSLHIYWQYQVDVQDLTRASLEAAAPVQNHVRDGLTTVADYRAAEAAIEGGLR